MSNDAVSHHPAIEKKVLEVGLPAPKARGSEPPTDLHYPGIEFNPKRMFTKFRATQL